MKIVQKTLDDAIPPLIEWMKRIKKNNVAIINEDYQKYTRLRILSSFIGIFCNGPIATIPTKKIIGDKYTIENINNKKKCGWRLLPANTKHPKLRTRGKTFIENITWLTNNKIDHRKYPTIEIIPQFQRAYMSAVFVITDKHVIGEMIRGDLWQLIYGVHKNLNIVNFIFDYDKWTFSKRDLLIEKILKKAVKKLKVVDRKKRLEMKKQIKANFNKHNNLIGYFEFRTDGKKILFTDYDRVVERLFHKQNLLNKSYIKGFCACPGIALGKIKNIINPKKQTLKKGEILVCPLLTIHQLDNLKKCSAVISKYGNQLSHAAIVARELKKPFVTNLGKNINNLKDGQEALVDATNGTIIIVD